MDTQTRHTKSFILYILAFLLTLHSAMSVYITSTYLSQFINEKLVGIVYALSSIVTIIAFITIPNLLKQYGNYLVIRTLILTECLAMLGLAYGTYPILVEASFVLNFVSLALISFNMDVFMESISVDSVTGSLRGFFLTSANIAWLIGPLIGSLILTDGNYSDIYISATVLLIPIFFFIQKHFRDFRDTAYTEAPWWHTVREIQRDKNIVSIFAVSFLLQIFYAWMVIYTPLYLHDHIGFPWSDIGIMFSIMLLPFVLIEIPLGKLADTRLGEKEILSLGFVIISLATMLIAFVVNNSFWLWTSILFVTRIGASMIEIMSETYFFKKVDSKRVNIISIFRTMRPWAYLVSPVIATILFTVIDFKYIFVVLGLIMTLGLRYSLSIEDTK